MCMRTLFSFPSKIIAGRGLSVLPPWNVRRYFRPKQRPIDPTEEGVRLDLLGARLAPESLCRVLDQQLSDEVLAGLADHGFGWEAERGPHDILKRLISPLPAERCDAVNELWSASSGR